MSRGNADPPGRCDRSDDAYGDDEVEDRRGPRAETWPTLDTHLPAAPAATSTATARGPTSAEPARAAGARWRVRDRARDGVVHRLQAVRKQGGLKRRIAGVPLAARARIDPFEGLGPLGDAAEHDCVGKQLGEDLSFFRELLPVFLGRCHIETEPKGSLQELAAACGALRHIADK